MTRLFLSMLLILTAFSCSSKPAEQSQTADQPTNGATIISAEGIGAVKLGMTQQQLPAKVDGLYDNAVFENSDFVLFSFYLNGDNIMSSNGDEKIELLEVCNPEANVRTADGVYCGMPASEFLSIGGWKQTEEQTYEKNGVKAVLSGNEKDPDTTVNCLSTGEYDNEF